MNLLKTNKYLRCSRHICTLLVTCCMGLAVFSQEDTAITLIEKLDTVYELPPEDITDEPAADEEMQEYFLPLNGQESDSINVRTVPDTTIKALQNADAFWYANANLKKSEKKTRQSSKLRLVEMQWFKTLIWIIIIGGFLAVLIWYLALSNVRLFRGTSSAIKSADADEIPENIFEINYQREIDKAIQAGQFRTGIRLMFLRLLKELSERNIIHYKQERTNFDYLMQLHPTVYYKDFFRLTRNYEYTWYGQFEVDREMFMTIKNDFEGFNQKLKQR